MTYELTSARESTRLFDAPSPSANQAAIGKLRRRLTGGTAEDGGSGLGDPFAEVFAAMATAPAVTPAPEEPVPTETKDQPVSSHNRDTEERPAEPESTSTSASNISVNVEKSLVDPSTENEVDAVASTLAQTEPTQDTPVTVVNNEEAPDGQFDHQANEHPQPFNEVVSEVTSEAQPQDSLVEAETVAVVDQGDNHRRSQTDAAHEVEVPESADASEAHVVLDAKTETRQSTNDPKTTDDQPASPNQEAAPQARLERRRYSDRSNQSNQSQTSEQTTAEDKASITNTTQENLSEGARRSGSGPTNGIDVSTMNATANTATVPVSPNVAAAVAAKAASDSAAAGVQGRPQSATGINATTASRSTDPAVATNSIGSAGNDSKSGNATKTSTGVDTTSAIERAKLIQRISRGFQHLGGGAGQIRMRLSPDHLGSVQLQMNVRDGGLSGRMTTQSDAATQLLREQLPQLRSALENQGIRLDHLEIETEVATMSTERESGERSPGERSGGFAGNQFANPQDLKDERQRRGWSDGTGAPRQRSTQDSSRTIVTPVSSSALTPGRVDIQV
jgi:flagellar hook-length control protein FliK